MQYKVTVNGKTYDVVVEKTGAAGAAPVASAPAAPVAAAPAPAASAPVATGGVSVESPMPGKILRINVAKGAAVKNGDVLMILEAMKMENEIPAPADGTVADIRVSEGASVNSGDVLIVLN